MIKGQHDGVCIVQVVTRFEVGDSRITGGGDCLVLVVKEVSNKAVLAEDWRKSHSELRDIAVVIAAHLLLSNACAGESGSRFKQLGDPLGGLWPLSQASDQSVAFSKSCKRLSEQHAVPRSLPNPQIVSVKRAN